MVKRDNLEVRFAGETISLATPLELRQSLELRRIPAITRWNRLEGRPRSTDFDRAMRAEVRDPLWNLSKQWQVGEFIGEDAGSPAGARILIEQTRFEQFAAADHPLEPLTDEEPLEMRIERRPVVWSYGDRPMALDLRLALGKRWRRILTANGLQTHFPKFRDAYSLASPDPDLPEHSDVTAHSAVWQTVEAVAGRMMDGRALYEFLAANPANRASMGIADLTTTEADSIDLLGDAFVQWVRRLLVEPGPGQDGWLPERLEYAAKVTTEPSAGAPRHHDETLIASEISDGRVDWYHFDREARSERPPPEPPEAEPVAFLPTPLDYGGMPNPRWWQFEEGATNFGAIDPGSSDIGKLLFLEHVLLYANDWNLFPYRVVAGSNALVRGLSIRNVFGERFWITAAGGRAGDSWQGWGMFANNALNDATDLSDRHITVLPVAPRIHDGQSAERQILIRDEMANQVWAIEKYVRTAAGRVLPGNQLASETRRWRQDRVGAPVAAPTLTEAALRYRLMTRVPEHWIPMIPVHKEGDNRLTKLQRAAMPRLLEGDHSTPERVRPRTALMRAGLDQTPRAPMFVEPEEVPRAGVQVIDGFRRTRWYAGRTYLWRGLRKHVGRGEGSSGLAFDQLFPKPVDALSAAPASAEGSGPIEVTADPPPALALAAHPDPGGGWAIEATVENFTFSPEHFGQDHVEGEGRLVLMINGVAAAALLDAWHYLPPLTPGEHQLAVAALANDGRPLVKNGMPISAQIMLTQAPASGGHSHMGAPEIVDAATAPALTLEALRQPDGATILRIGWSNFDIAPLAAAGAHAPGQGHIHLSIDGVKLTRLYASAFLLPPLANGQHVVSVAAFTNDHRAYETSAGPVMAMIEVAGIEARPLSLSAALPDPHEHH